MSSASSAQVSQHEAGEAPARSLSANADTREERVVDACDCVIEIAAAIFSLPSRELRRPGRCADAISRVRQIAMYVTHVVLGLSMTEIGKGFGRDRTTVMHACHLVEDLRDDDDFDQIIARAEHIVTAAFRGRMPV